MYNYSQKCSHHPQPFNQKSSLNPSRLFIQLLNEESENDVNDSCTETEADKSNDNKTSFTGGDQEQEQELTDMMDNNLRIKEKKKK